MESAAIFEFKECEKCAKKPGAANYCQACYQNRVSIDIANKVIKQFEKPVPMILHCPECHHRHVDQEEWATRIHHTHACQACGFVWRPAVVATVGVRFLPGFKNK